MQRAAATTTAAACVLGLLFIFNNLPLSSGHPTIIERSERDKLECEGCGHEAECNQKCEYGSELSRWCGGMRQCLKGPGEMCGGVRNKYGSCGDGMFCRCNKCMGCSSKTLDCFSGLCPEVDHQSLYGLFSSDK